MIPINEEAFKLGAKLAAEQIGSADLLTPVDFAAVRPSLR